MKAACWLRRHWILPLISISTIVCLVLLWNWAGDQAAERERADKVAAAARTALLSQTERIVDCTTPGFQCFEDGQKRSAQTLGAAFVQIDCVIRRAIAGLPAPDPARGPCTAQTPPSVYPGD